MLSGIPRKRAHQTRGTTNAPLSVDTARWLAEAAQKECFSLITYTDKTLNCVDSGTEFSFTARDQQIYADSNGGGYSSGGGGYGGGYSDQPREMFTTTCDSCGKEARVPVRPTGTKPVYCSDCFRR